MLKIFCPTVIRGDPDVGSARTNRDFFKSGVNYRSCAFQVWRTRGLSTPLVHAGGDYHGMCPAVGTRGMPEFLVMVPGGFVDDTICRIALRAGELDNISGSRARNIRYCGVFYHGIMGSCFSESKRTWSHREIRSSLQRGGFRIAERRSFLPVVPGDTGIKTLCDYSTIGGHVV